jgi:hypothetical protein
MRTRASTGSCRSAPEAELARDEPQLVEARNPGFVRTSAPRLGEWRGAERILADADTLMVFGLDHILSEQEAAPEEIAAIREWLSRDGACPLLAPDHDVGFTGDMKQRRVNICIKRQGLLPRVLVAASPKLIGDYLASGC